jgi:hypothetical protein
MVHAHPQNPIKEVQFSRQAIWDFKGIDLGQIRFLQHNTIQNQISDKSEPRITIRMNITNSCEMSIGNLQYLSMVSLLPMLLLHLF